MSSPIYYNGNWFANEDELWAYQDRKWEELDEPDDGDWLTGR